MGRKFKFFDFSTSWPEAKRGRLYSYKDSKGHETVVSYNGSYQITDFVMAAGSNSQGYYYSYYKG